MEVPQDILGLSPCFEPVNSHYQCYQILILGAAEDANGKFRFLLEGVVISVLVVAVFCCCLFLHIHVSLKGQRSLTIGNSERHCCLLFQSC
jgi:hypothetical protein